jgi:hypothetical protein
MDGSVVGAVDGVTNVGQSVGRGVKVGVQVGNGEGVIVGVALGGGVVGALFIVGVGEPVKFVRSIARDSSGNSPRLPTMRKSNRPRVAKTILGIEICPVLVFLMAQILMSKFL